MNVILHNLHKFFSQVSESLEIVISKNLINENHVGHLVPLKCGHRGKPNRSEEKLLENLIF